MEQKQRISFSGSVFTEVWESLEEYLLFLKEVFSYKFVATRIPFNSTVLELGFGEGFGTRFLEKKSKQIIALDVDKKALAHAIKKHPSKKTSFKLYDGKTIPFNDNFFDVIVLLQVIEHVSDDVAFVQEIKRVARKGAKIFLTTPNAELRMTKNNNPWNEFHCREYSPKELEVLLRKSFNKVEIFGIFSTDKIMEIEINRIRNAVFLASLDPLKIRRFLPFHIKDAIKKIARIFLLRERRIFDVNQFSERDFYVSKQNLGKSIDLLAICKK